MARTMAVDKLVERAEGKAVQPVISMDAELAAPIDLQTNWTTTNAR